ncbi:phosphoribosylglycinamide formyltransferase [Paradevosia shaoguanensis]|uniref:Phosphoribosylglycinamide formyltransferase n=1 Tax=Paradevosia shaoguanensis TaxID=1335043 RepID=A0AA41QM10_9HYPH|nr:phosphoribosylglycinamide formyltransferase [Paradevosia shaoguanensis]MCF1742868.1 phosphoribosylglycinamide formyltransferase [Paradevosia shaoguanensis]MCI0127351.1 phosphoribosylglycinamide formyltransferase [Paradevosia shaoguanensis]
MTTRKRVAVLISGRGSNMTALIEAAKIPGYPAEIVGVLSNRSDAAGLETAAANGIPTAVRSHRDFPDRNALDAALDDVLRGWNTEIVALAGFMRLLTPRFTERWLGRMINIHPALLPSFKGLHTHEQALAAGVHLHGCTVHFVTPGMDEGPAIMQAAVPVVQGDTPDTLAARVLRAEHRIYPRALAALADGRVSLVDGRVMLTADTLDDEAFVWPKL